MTSLRCALVGLDSAFWPVGFWQSAHDHPDTELVAACGLGVDPPTIERDFILPVDPWLKERGLERLDTLDDLLACDFDVALLSSRNTVMPEVADRLIDAGKHVLVAKPIALSASEARRYLRARERGVVVAAVQAASAWQPWPTMLRLADEGSIGRVLTMRVMHQHGDYSSFPSTMWYADPREGDMFNWLGWYPAEAITAAMGPVARVSGVARRTVSSHGDMPDHVAGIFDLVDGRHATANVYFTIGDWPMPMQEGELVGESGVLRHCGPGSTVQLLNAEGERQLPFDAGPDQLAAEFAAFIDAVRGSGNPVVEVERAVHVASVCAAWRESAAIGGPVAVAQ